MTRSLRTARQRSASLVASHCTIRLTSCLRFANPSYSYSQNLSTQPLGEFVSFPLCPIPVEDRIRRRNREECTRLLTLLVSRTQRLLKPYALPMLGVLLLQAIDSHPTVAAKLVICLAELAVVGA